MLVVFTCILTLRYLGALQFLEFRWYDFLIRDQRKSLSTEPLVLVEMTEPDIQSPSLDHPIPDDKLAALLSKLAAQEPAVIGLDIWRDIPVPKSGVSAHLLDNVLHAHPNIIGIYTLAGIAPPPALRDNHERIGFNDNFPFDVNVDRTIPKVRRAVLYASSHSDEVAYSFPFQMALLYLHSKGIEAMPVPDDPESVRLGKALLRPLRQNDGAYVRADAGGCQILLDFKCPDQFTCYSVTEALADRIPAGSLKGRIVIVGINAASVSDERVTPVSRDHRGIRLQAMTVHQLLRQALNGETTLRFWPDWGEDAWIFAWCAVGGAIGYRARSPVNSAAVNLLFLSILVGIGWASFTYGWWLPVISPALAYIPASGLVVSYIAFHEKKERSQLMQLFSKQVSPDIAKALWEQRDEFLAGHRPRSQKLTATVLFTDMAGFTAISEKMEPSVLMDWLNDYMEAMATAIMAHHGVVEKYIGDAIMAVFGVPLARTSDEEIRQDARNAVRCALTMAEELAKLNGRWAERGLPRSGMRIGIHTGPLVAGSLGSVDRQEYTVIGDSVNTASRLESFKYLAPELELPNGNSACRILISESTHRLLNGEFQTREVGTIALKNKADPVTIYRVFPPTKATT